MKRTYNCLRNVRRFRGYTQSSLAEKANMSQALISAYESGERGITGANADILSKILNFPARLLEKPWDKKYLEFML